ncbi:MAG TPA: cyclic pyranopterin monophosphate synthase MoaC [Longimicrobium sp.]|jgi:cyclic pyranopterin phosphate synthase
MSGESGFTHLDEHGRPRMVDVGDKEVTRRTAVAEGRIRMAPATLAAVVEGRAAKGAVLTVAEVAGIMGAKRTADLIPLCHPLPLTSVAVVLEVDHALPGLRATATTRTDGKTGVEMEALTAVSCALLTVYDMCKGMDRGMAIVEVRLLHKEGGQSGVWTAAAGA